MIVKLLELNELRALEPQALSQELADVMKQQFVFRMQRYSGNENTSKALHVHRLLRRQVARIKTLLLEKGVRS